MPLDPMEIRSSICKLRKSLKKTAKRASPDDVHQLRTRIRRFEALQQATVAHSGRLSRRLKRVRKKAGRVRDMDVLTSHLASVHSDKDQSCLIELFEYLGNERYRYAANLHETLRKHVPSLRKQLKRACNAPAQTDKADGSSPPGAAQILGGLAGLSQPLRLNRSNLHPYRLKVKELHDLIKLQQAPKSDRSKDLADSLRECKDAIGEWHDWEELISIAGKHLDHRSACPLIRELRTISKRKFDLALASAAKLRGLYAKPRLSSKSSSRSQLLPELAIRTVSNLVH